MKPLDFAQFFARHEGRAGRDVAIGARGPLVIIAGPCVLDPSDAVNVQIAETLRDACASAGLPYIFKASYDKANRSSAGSSRGPGIDRGCETLQRLRDRLGVLTTTDIHEPSHAAIAAAAVDILQIPAFLARQSDLLAAAAATGRAVNVKKGQFMAPAEMAGAIGKLRESGALHIMLTERGTFFGYHRLVNDFVGLADMMDLGVPVCFDASHSTQRPGEGTTSGGVAHRAPLLARAAVSAGADAIFFECHPDPAKSPSDRATIQPLATVVPLICQLSRLRDALLEGQTAQ